MQTARQRWVLHAPGWLLLGYLVVAQAIPAFDYELGVRMGTQESAASITEVGTAFWFGFAFGDLLIYIPLLAAGLVGDWVGVKWGSVVLGAALGITAYWPVVCLSAVVAARDATGWALTNETTYWLVLPPISLWAIWCLYCVGVGSRRAIVEAGDECISVRKTNRR